MLKDNVLNEHTHKRAHTHTPSETYDILMTDDLMVLNLRSHRLIVTHDIVAFLLCYTMQNLHYYPLCIGHTIFIRINKLRIIIRKLIEALQNRLRPLPTHTHTFFCIFFNVFNVCEQKENVANAYNVY